MLPPGYRIVTYLDSAVDRHERRAELPGEHRVTIDYHDGRGHSYSEDSVVDLTIWDGLMFAERFGVHDAAEALREIKKLLDKAPLLKGGLEVVVEERETHVERVRAQNATRAAQHQAMLDRMEASRAAQSQGDISKA